MPATNKIDVFVAESSIKQPFEYIGKGYLNANGIYRNPQLIQEKAEQLGMKKGADAVLITDYIITGNGTNIVSVIRTDSIPRGSVTTANTSVSPTYNQSYQIYYLKYNR